MSSNNEKCKTRPALIDLNPVKCNYLFVISLAKFYGRCNTFSKIYSRICFPNKTEDVNLTLFLYGIKKNESKTIKLVSAIFYQLFISPQMIADQKLWKMLFISFKKLFLFSRYSNFCICIFPSFLPVSHCFKG